MEPEEITVKTGDNTVKFKFALDKIWQITEAMNAVAQLDVLVAWDAYEHLLL